MKDADLEALYKEIVGAGRTATRLDMSTTAGALDEASTGI